MTPLEEALYMESEANKAVKEELAWYKKHFATRVIVSGRDVIRVSNQDDAIIETISRIEKVEAKFQFKKGDVIKINLPPKKH